MHKTATFSNHGIKKTTISNAYMYLPFIPSTQLHVRHDKNFWIHHRNRPPPTNDTRVPTLLTQTGAKADHLAPEGGGSAAPSQPPAASHPPAMRLVTGVLVPADATGITKIQQMAYRTATSLRRERAELNWICAGRTKEWWKFRNGL